MSDDPGTALHVVTGDSAAGTLREVLGGGPSSVLVQHDVLSWGPLQRLDSLESWRSVREGYWRSIWTGPPLETLSFDLLENADALRRAGSVTAWTAGGTSDQLLIPFLGQLFALIDADLSKLRMVEIERHARTGTVVAGIGELSPHALRSVPAPSPIGHAALRDAAGAWNAVTATEPSELLAFIGREPESLARLPRALASIVDRYPDERLGLGRWDEVLLTSVHDHGPHVARILARAMASESGALDPSGDLILLGRLKRLAHPGLPRPLVELSGSASAPGTEARDWRARVTSAGEDVLTGGASFVDMNGIDDWIGGVHLDSRAGRVWVRRGGSLVRLGS